VTEHRANVVIMTHVLHRIGEFLDEHPAETFTDEGELGRTFIRWLSAKDAPEVAW
jgi:hypothetical protein